MNMGLIGAIGGAAEGFDSYISEEQKMRRAQKMEELRTSNNRETNRMNNDQRHTQSLEQAGVKNENDISLENLRAKNDMARQEKNNEAIASRPTTMMQNHEYLSGQGVTDAADRVAPLPGKSGKPDRTKMITSYANSQGLDLSSAQQEFDRVFPPGEPMGIPAIDSMEEGKRNQMLEMFWADPQANAPLLNQALGPGTAEALMNKGGNGR